MKLKVFLAFRAVYRLYSSICLIIYMSLVAFVSAESNNTSEAPPDCFLASDKDASVRFQPTPWMQRGLCIRQRKHEDICDTRLETMLNYLIELRKAEYGGAAGALALLPTIGALLGAPTNEVWTLLNILPFGGALVMALSFGGAIVPVQVEEYEHTMKKQNIAIGSIVSFRPSFGELDPNDFTQKLALLESKVSERVSRPERRAPEKRYLGSGLLAMALLLVGSQSAMAVVERGGIIPWWCGSIWWMHLWYLLVTFFSVLENWTQIPFVKQHKLYISEVPYDIILTGGESIFTDLHKSGSEHEAVERNLQQLKTMRAAKVAFSGSTHKTQPRNTVLVMVSVVGTHRWASLSRLITKSGSIAVFITGTAMFASVTLVSLLMAVFALTLIISAGVYGRAIAGWMVHRVAEKEPMIHVIVNTPEEASHCIRCILKLELPRGEDLQVEIQGQIFVNGRRVASRSRLWLAILGVLASPYDLPKVIKGRKDIVGQPLLNTLSSNQSLPT